MPEMTPVANQVIPPDPTKGINTFSGILGLKQKQLQIQTAQAALPGVQAESQQQVQTAGQRSALAQYMQNTDLSQRVVKDGTLDLNILSDPNLRKAAGDSFPEVAQQLLTVKNSQLEAKSRLAGLNDTLRSQFGRTVGSLREDDDVKADNNVGRAKVKDAMDQFSASGGPDAQRIADIYEPMLGHVPKGKLSSSLGYLQLQAQSASGQAEQQNLKQTTNAAGQVINVAPMTGAISMPLGTGGRVNPASPAVAGATTAATGAGGIDNQTFGNVMTASAKSGTVIDLAKKVRELAAQARTGKLTGEFAENLTILKQSDPEATARQLMEKYAANLKTAVESTGGTDAEREQIGSGFPTPKTMNPGALEEAAGYAEGTGHLARARGENAAAHYQQHGTQGLAAADNEFMKSKSPLTYAPKNSAAQGGGLVRVKSVQEARALAPGTHFLTPDGREKVR